MGLSNRRKILLLPYQFHLLCNPDDGIVKLMYVDWKHKPPFTEFRDVCLALKPASPGGSTSIEWVLLKTR